MPWSSMALATRADDGPVATMLVVTANWAFTDATVVATAGRSRAAHEWLRGIRLVTIRSGFGRDGTYRPPAALDVVLAGDTFDTLASAAWHGRDRPWHGGARVAEARRQVLRGCTRGAARFLAGLARLARSGLAAPAADRRGRPAPAAVVRVPVRIAVLVGDRDRHVAEAVVGIEARGASVAPAWSDGTVLVGHGHEFDPACHVATSPSDRERPPTLAESVTIDLVTAFAVRLADAGLPRHATAPLVEALVAAGPAEVPAVLAAWIAGDGLAAALGVTRRRDVKATWDRAVDAWLRAARRDPPDCGLAASPLESLAGWFRATDAVPPPALQPLFDRGLSAAAGASGTAQAVVLGHPASAHCARAICLGRPPMRRWGPLAVSRGPVAADVACVVAAPVAVGPATVACRRDGDRLEWHWPAAAGAPTAEIDTAVVVDAA